MNEICQNCNTIIKDNYNNCSQCEETNEVEEYDKIAGWLLLIAILLVLGSISMLPSLVEVFKNEYITILNELINNEMYEYLFVLHIKYYITLIISFFLLLFTITLFSKSNKTKIIAISYFSISIILNILGFIIFGVYEELFEAVTTTALIQLTSQIIFALIAILYFIYSKRVKETFTKERKLIPRIIISGIVPIILCIIYYNQIKEIEQENTYDKNMSLIRNTSIYLD